MFLLHPARGSSTVFLGLARICQETQQLEKHRCRQVRTVPVGVPIRIQFNEIGADEIQAANTVNNVPRLSRRQTEGLRSGRAHHDAAVETVDIE